AQLHLAPHRHLPVQGGQSGGDGRGLFHCRGADRVPAAPVRQGSAPPQVGPRGQVLLDRAKAPRSRRQRDEEPVLRGLPVSSILRELWAFLRVRKKYWLLPAILMLGVMGGLVVLTQGSAIAPFIYTLF